MNQSERRQFLIRELLQEEPEYREMAVPADAEDQKYLLRGLLNVRPPRQLPQRFLAEQDAYLKE